MTAIALGFVPEPITVSLDRILPSRKVPAGLATSRKFRQVKSSIEEVGLIEPLSVAALDAASGHHLLLDGHVRLVALQALGHASASCLVAKDDEGYTYNKERDNVILILSPALAPVQAAVFPLVTKGEDLELARKVHAALTEEFNVAFDVSGSIGKRYARNDEIGTPYCITIDEESATTGEVTIRNRDTTKQVRVKMNVLSETLRKLISGTLEFSKAGTAVK